MGLKKVLSKLKLVEFEGGAAAPAATTAPAARPATRAGGAVDLEALLRAMPEPRPIDPAALPDDPGAGGDGEAADTALPMPDFAAVYRSAGVDDPAHGFTAFKVLEILRAPEFANLDGPARAAALAAFLKMNPSGPVPIGDVIQDAVRRDQALDRFEDFLRQKLESRAARLAAENAALEAEIEELLRRRRQQLAENNEVLDRERQRFEAWRARKAEEENRLAAAVAPFVEQNPITATDAEVS